MNVQFYNGIEIKAVGSTLDKTFYGDTHICSCITKIYETRKIFYLVVAIKVSFSTNKLKSGKQLFSICHLTAGLTQQDHLLLS